MSVNKVQLANGETIIDISDSTVTPETLAEGVTAHDASGQKITGKMVPGGGSSVQSDWNQTDETAADFVKNKTHYKTYNVILEEQELPFNAEMGGCFGIVSAPIQEGDVLSVTYDGVTYETKAMFLIGVGGIVFGNLSLFDIGTDTGEPFLGAYMDNVVTIMSMDEDNHIFKIAVANIAKLAREYLDKSVFYIRNIDKYLYTDIGFTTKATMFDITDASNISIFLVSDGVIAMSFAPVAVTELNYNLQKGYCTVLSCGSENGSLITRYSSEYTES